MYKRKKEIAFDLILLLIVGTFVVGSFQWQFQAKALPALLGSISLIFLIVIIALGVVRSTSPNPQKDTDDLVSIVELGKGTGWLIFLFLLILTTGFFLGPALFGASYAFVKRMSLRAFAMYSVVVPLVIWLVFAFGLQLNLWPGVIPSLVPKWVGGGVLPPL